MKNNPSILVTGGTGFIGANLVKKLYNGKNKITVFAKDEYHPFLKGLKINVVKGDIRNYNSTLKAIKSHQYVYHLAACSLFGLKDKDKIFGTNVRGTENVMKACLEANVKKVVHVSSSAVYGFSKGKRRKLNEKNNLDMKDNLYAISKKLGEDIVRDYVKKGLKATIICPSFVIGPGEVDPKRYILAQSIAKGRIRFTFPGGGGNVAVEDIVEGLVLAMEKGRIGERYILSTNNIRIYDFYNLVASILKKPKIKLMIPRALYYPMYALGALLNIMMENPTISPEAVRWHFNYKYFDASKAKKELGWKPKITLQESIKRAINYYKSIGQL